MKYKKNFETIMNELKAHKSNVDNLSKSYKAEKTSFESDLQQMKGKYTDSYIAESRKNWKPKLNYAQQINESRNRHRATVDFYLSNMEKQLNNYFNSPVKREFADKINSIKLCGLQLTNTELNLLQQSTTSYLERRLLNEIASSRTATDRGKTVPNGYAYIDVPDIEATYRAYNNFASQCRNMIENYSGENVELAEFLGNDVPVYVTATADSILKESSQSKNEFLNVMEKAVSIIPQPKTKLTEHDIKLIDAIIDPKYPNIAEGQIKSIAENSPELKELFALDERYSKYVTESEE